MKVVVSSENPVKIHATMEGFEKAFGSVPEIEAVKVSSGISEQPLSSEETLEGALNRAKGALSASPGADYYVGIEGGLEKINGEYESHAWIVVMDKNGKVGKGRSGSFFLPASICDLIDEGLTLGQADDKYFNRENSKQKDGAVGILSKGKVNRKQYYVDAVVFALFPFLNPEMY